MEPFAYVRKGKEIGTLGNITSGESIVEKVAGDFRFLEGPIWTRSNTLIFSDIPADVLYELEPNGEVQKFRVPSRHANGNTLDLEGRLITCEHGSRDVTRTNKDGTVEILASRFEGKKLNSPNDCAVFTDGSIFFTDPPYGIGPDQEELGFYALFRIRPDGGLELLKDDFVKPNGLVFSPDFRTLYVADTERYHIRAFQVEENGQLTGGGEFAEVKGADDAGPDGMRVDVNGNIYCTGSGGIHVFSAKGDRIALIQTPETPANCTFGDEDGKTLYITARTSLYKVRVENEGVRPGF
ncbi:MAG: SMP-30/gluconolactonase/LRE family protein [Fimbriimonadaceae bacterium]